MASAGPLGRSEGGHDRSNVSHTSDDAGRRGGLEACRGARASCRDAARVRPLLSELDTASHAVAEDSGRYSDAGPSLSTAVEMRQLLGRLTEKAKLADGQVWSALSEANAAGIVEWLAMYGTLEPSAPRPLRAARADGAEALRLHREAAAARAAGDRALAACGRARRRPCRSMARARRVPARVGRAAEAVGALQQAFALDPRLAAAYNEIGMAFADARLFPRAIEAFQRALELKPDAWDPWVNLGALLQRQGELDAAIEAWEEAVDRRPECAEAWSNLGGAFKELGMLERAEDCHRRALAHQPSFAAAHSNLLLTLHYHRGDEGALLLEEHLAFARAHADPLTAASEPHPKMRDCGRRLRVGYVSADFRLHPVAAFFRAAAELHDRTQVEVVAFSDVSAPDAVTRRLRERVDGWHDISPLDDAQEAERVRREGIDILVDLGGHTAQNRMLLFARKPAPVQMTWLGYPNTTGLAAMDARISDSVADPPGRTDAFCRERLVRLPRRFLCWSPPDEAPEVALPPALATGHVTFGSFNALAKVAPRTLELWAGVLRAVPGSSLLVKAGALNAPSARRQLIEQMERAGVIRDRLELHGAVPDTAEHLASWGRVDIALDTFPYHGTTTTCEALWMGVPLVTYAGPTHVSGARTGSRSRPRASSGWPPGLPPTSRLWLRCAQGCERACELPRCSTARASRAPSRPPTGMPGRASAAIRANSALAFTARCW